MLKNTAIVYITYDGAINSASGVGVLSRYFIEAMPKVIQNITEQDNRSLSFHVIAIDLNSQADGYEQQIAEKTVDVCHSLGGELHLIDNGHDGFKGYGGPDNWRTACENTAKEIARIAEIYEHTIVYAVDTPFLCLPYYYQKDTCSDVTFIIVPHSDTFSHFPDAIDVNRLGWEAASMQALVLFDNVYLAKTSEFLLANLRDHYDIPHQKVVSLQTGLVPDSSRFTVANAKDIVAALRIRNIPRDRELLFSVGRGVEYKGFTDLLYSFAKLLPSAPNSHLVFVAPPHKNENGITYELNKLIVNLGISDNCTAIYELDMDLPRLICQWHLTRIVAQLSSREPFGLVPEEVRLWAHKEGPLVVASNLDGFKEQIDNRVDGFLVNPKDHNVVAKLFNEVLSMEASARESMRSRGKERALRDYDYMKEVKRSCRDLINKGKHDDYNF